MNSSEAADTPPKRGAGKKRRCLSAEKKFQVFLEAQPSTEPIGEILRREGLYSTDLARIRQQVREGAIQRLGAKPGRKAEVVAQFADDLEARDARLARPGRDGPPSGGLVRAAFGRPARSRNRFGSDALGRGLVRRRGGRRLRHRQLRIVVRHRRARAAS